MHYVTVALLSSILMLSILIDVLRFPLLRKDRGSRFFSELTITIRCTSSSRCCWYRHTKVL